MICNTAPALPAGTRRRSGSSTLTSAAAAAAPTAGLLNKAQRGELALTLPVGLVRDPLGRVLKHPDQEVQHRLELVFTSFLQVKSACQVVRFFNGRDLLLPRKDRFGDLVWRPPT